MDISLFLRRLYLRIRLDINLPLKDIDLLKKVQLILKVGRIHSLPTKNLARYTISKGDLQEIVLPLIISYKMLFMLTDNRRKQFDRAIYIIHNNLYYYSNIPSIIPTFEILLLPNSHIELSIFNCQCTGLILWRSNLTSNVGYPSFDPIIRNLIVLPPYYNAPLSWAPSPLTLALVRVQRRARLPS